MSHDLTLSARIRRIDAYLAGGWDALTLWRYLLAALVRDSRLGETEVEAILAAPEFADLHPATVTLTEDLLAGATMGEMSVVYEYLLAANSMADKRANGQFFTPDDAAQFMAERADRFGPGVWLDPCCGVGNLSYWLIARQPDPERYLLDNMRFIDLDPLALLSTRVLLTVAFQREERGVFERLRPHFHEADFLHPDSLLDIDFDYLLLNPPYLKGVKAPEGMQTAQSGDVYVYFLERAFTVMAKGVVAVTPQSFTHGDRYDVIRRIILEHCGSVDVYVFDNMPAALFQTVKFGTENTNKKNSTRAAITVAKPTVENSKLRVTPMMRWTAKQRADLLAQADDLLAPIHHPTETAFPKVEHDLIGVYDNLLTCDTTVGRLSVPLDQADVVLTVPRTPRYFLSATRRQLDRTSLYRIGFREADWRRVYLTLNSSAMYLWWRAHDDGMMLSRKVLESMPIPAFDQFDPEVLALVEALEQSEVDNLVAKKNAGKMAENVKHPEGLVVALNAALFPYVPAATFLGQHTNSSLAT